MSIPNKRSLVNHYTADLKKEQLFFAKIENKNSVQKKGSAVWETICL